MRKQQSLVTKVVQGNTRGVVADSRNAATGRFIEKVGFFNPTAQGQDETFQVITQFGNGDPKVMAGGISMALVTTVLGLIAAMPLLLAHTILNSQAENVRNILEKQGIGLVAEQAEREPSHSIGTPNDIAESAA